MGDFNNIEKSCGFYISNMHFITMILPFIKTEMEEKNNIITLFELDLEKNINSVIEKLILSEAEKENILSINWKNTEIKGYQNFQKKLKENINGNTVILICGSEDYINNTNLFIENYIRKTKQKFINIEIINFYNAEDFKDNVTNILDNHKNIINTSGKHLISDIFEEYKDKEEHKNNA